VFALLIHSIVLSLLWRQGFLASPPVSEMQAPQEVMIELSPDLSLASTRKELPSTPALPSLQNFHASALERTTALEQTLMNALAQQVESETTRQQQLATLQAHQATLHGQVEALETEQADLSAQLTNERQRSAVLEQQLQEARQAKEAELSNVRGAYDRLVAALQTEISQKEISLRQAKEGLTVTILDRVLFPSGQATLTPEGQQVIAKVGTVLAKMGSRRVLIEGHTDNVPIGAALSGRFPTNWELSAARATEVVRYLIAMTKLPPHRLSAVGRADTAPAASNATEDGRQQNRRIEIIVLPLEGHSTGLS
jgi:chemotaxis protein MotB